MTELDNEAIGLLADELEAQLQHRNVDLSISVYGAIPNAKRWAVLCAFSVLPLTMVSCCAIGMYVNRSDEWSIFASCFLLPSILWIFGISVFVFMKIEYQLDAMAKEARVRVSSSGFLIRVRRLDLSNCTDVGIETQGMRRCYSHTMYFYVGRKKLRFITGEHSDASPLPQMLHLSNRIAQVLSVTPLGYSTPPRWEIKQAAK